ncbi:MAG: arginine--tRNA ligase [Candidatus Nanoarchaeia archaeon]|nr:arginine--tRNA ligase [Candidatus Nanoarchaeia archaeon]
MEIFKKEIEKALKPYAKGEMTVEIPPDSKLGDYAFPCFNLAKQLRKSPADIAKDLSLKIKPNKYIREIRNVGPYVNFFINNDILNETILNEILKNKEKYGLWPTKHKKVVIEFPSPNTNKPLHLGHARNMLIGESLSRILEFDGYKVFRVNLNNDRGVHICKSMLAYKKWGDSKTPESENKKSDHFVGDFYVLYSKKAKENPGLDNEAQEMLKKWENNDKETVELWKKMNNWAIKGFNETYNMFGIKHDKTYNESEHYDDAKKIVLDNFKKGIFKKDEEGNIYVELEKYSLPNKILLRADGTSVYMTQDIMLAKIKYNDFKMDKSIFVVGSEQKLHFNQLFKILELIGFKNFDGCYHLAYGMISLPEGKMKSREGTVVDADDIVEDMISLAKQEIEKRHDINKKEIEERAKTIGLGALNFFVLKYDALKDFVFNPKESISFEGETGPYIQYAHARICSILRKAGKQAKDIDLSLLNKKEEKDIIKLLGSFPEVIDSAASGYKPSLIARYLLDLSQLFNEFYHKHQIIKADEKTRDARLALIKSIKYVVENGLNLLGIDAPEKM